MYYESFPRKVQRERSLRWTGLWRSVRKFDEAFGPKGRSGDFAADKKRWRLAPQANEDSRIFVKIRGPEGGHDVALKVFLPFF